MSLSTSSDQAVPTPAGLRIRDFLRSDGERAATVALGFAKQPVWISLLKKLQNE